MGLYRGYRDNGKENGNYQTSPDAKSVRHVRPSFAPTRPIATHRALKWVLYCP